MDTRFVPPDISAQPPSFPWLGRDEHTGSTRYRTALFDRLDLKTTCAYITLCAGTVVWAALRLEGYRDEHQTALCLTDAAMAYQVDWRYVDRDAVDISIQHSAPPELSALFELCIFMWRCIDKDTYWNNYYSPVLEVFHAVHLTRHMLAASSRPAYSKWLRAVIDRLDIVAPKPDEKAAKPGDFDTEAEWLAFTTKHRGHALPPDVLDPNFSLNALHRKKLVGGFLRNLDWTLNPFLRSPQQMKQMGFKAIPYEEIGDDGQ